MTESWTCYAILSKKAVRQAHKPSNSGAKIPDTLSRLFQTVPLPIRQFLEAVDRLPTEEPDGLMARLIYGAGLRLRQQLVQRYHAYLEGELPT